MYTCIQLCINIYNYITSTQNIFVKVIQICNSNKFPLKFFIFLMFSRSLELEELKVWGEL